MSVSQLLTGFKYVRGITDVAHLQDYPEFADGRLQAYSTSIEVFRETDGRHMGVVATKYTVPRPSLADNSRAVLLKDGVGSTALMHENVERVVCKWHGPESVLSPVLHALGVRASREVYPDQAQLMLVVPDRPEVGTEYLRKLGISDRKFVAYNGGAYSAADGVAAMMRGEFLWANEYPHHIHDRTIHYPAAALVSPILLREVQELAKQSYGTPRLSRAMQAIDLLTLPVVGLHKSDTTRAREDVASALYAIFDNYLGGGRISELAADALEWRDTLISRARNASPSI